VQVWSALPRVHASDEPADFAQPLNLTFVIITRRDAVGIHRAPLSTHERFSASVEHYRQLPGLIARAGAGVLITDSRAYAEQINAWSAGRAEVDAAAGG
jgi:hypothetical protein